MKRAAVALIERADGRILCVWNRRYGGWSLPGGMVEDTETLEEALLRELREETGLGAAKYTPVFDSAYENPESVKLNRARHVHVYRVLAAGEPREMETGCPVTWFTREEFLKWSPFAELYATVFEVVPYGEDLWAAPMPAEPGPP
jgi:8-oxo-dGTP pyrophosphatase MutT (NUDIX family)